MTHWLLVGLLLTAANEAGAVDVPHAPAHGAQTAGAHPSGDSAEHGTDAAAHEGEHEYTYTGDDDHDGVPNWRDPMNGSEPNTHTYVVSSLGFHALNLALLLGVLVYFVRRPLVDTFRDRALSIRTDLTESARKRDEAHQRHQDLLARLEKIENEVQKMESEAEGDAQREEEKLIERAHREAGRILEQAERNIRDETTRARIELRKEAVELAVQLAEATLQSGVSPADHQNLAREFLRSVKGADHV